MKFKTNEISFKKAVKDIENSASTWIDLMCLPDDCQPSASCNSGINLITELHYQIFYQNTGNVLTPQPKVNFKFAKANEEIRISITSTALIFMNLQHF